MNAEEVVKALGGRWYGSYGMVKCPVHSDRTPSLKISDSEGGGLRVYCFAGCSWRHVKDSLRRDGLLPPWQESPPASSTRSHARPSAKPKAERDPEEAGRIEAARRIWNDALPASGTLVEVYLRSRFITMAIPPTIRFASKLKHSPTGVRLPAMVCAVQGPDRTITGVHRTFLRIDGKAKAPFTKPKMMLGRCAGGAVRLAAAGPTLAIGEGIETALTVMQEAGIPTWAALSAHGMAGVILPPCVREVVLCPDGDQPGNDAAKAAAKRFISEGRQVRVARPPDGEDFNDLVSKAICDG